MSSHTKTSPQLALKMTYRHTNAGTLKEGLCHVCGFLTDLLCAHAVHFHSIPSGNHSGIYHCDHANLMYPDMSESLLEMA